jgi:hypothetical protein
MYQVSFYPTLTLPDALVRELDFPVSTKYTREIKGVKNHNVLPYGYATLSNSFLNFDS